MTIAMPSIRVLEEQVYACDARTTPLSGLAEAVGAGFATVSDRIRGRNMQVTGAPFVRYRRIDMAGTLDIETGIPVVAAGQATAGPGFGRIPGGRYGCLIHPGPHDGMISANAALIAWGAENGIAWAMRPTPTGDVFDCRLEIYHTGPADRADPTAWETEIAIRIADEPEPSID